jgi:hypothetical protein
LLRNMDVIKASGEKQRFSQEKLSGSIKRAGVESRLAKDIAKTVAKNIKGGVDTGKILNQALHSLQKQNPALAAKYNLKKAIMELGPAGFTFEKYVAEIFKEYGYSVKTGETVKGYCVNHEIDVIAQKDNKHFMIECKYHNERGIRSDVKVALYTFARFLDVKKAWEGAPGHKDFFHQAWLVTNTKCTKQAILYARCAGLKIISWRYPRSESLEYLIEKKKLYPITIFPFLSRYVKERLVEGHILLVKDLLKYSIEGLARTTGLESNIIEKLQKQARELVLN